MLTRASSRFILYLMVMYYSFFTHGIFRLTCAFVCMLHMYCVWDMYLTSLKSTSYRISRPYVLKMVHVSYTWISHAYYIRLCFSHLTGALRTVYVCHTWLTYVHYICISRVHRIGYRNPNSMLYLRMGALWWLLPGALGVGRGPGLRPGDRGFETEGF